MKPVAASDYGTLLTPKQAATYSGLDVSTICRLAAKGDLVAVRHSNGRLLGIYSQDMDGWIRTHRGVPADRPSAAALSVDARIRELMPRNPVFAVD